MEPFIYVFVVRLLLKLFLHDQAAVLVFPADQSSNADLTPFVLR
jgi:hypothetical protein